MWYLRTLDNRDFLFFNNSEVSIFIDREDTENLHYQQYLAWVAEGNTATEWSPNGD
jgi:hypothetical protein